MWCIGTLTGGYPASLEDVRESVCDVLLTHNPDMGQRHLRVTKT